MVLLNVKGETLIIFKKLLRIGGIWPLDNYKRGSTIIFSVILLAQIVVVVTRLIDPFEKCPSYKPESDDTILTAVIVAAVIQLLALRIRGTQMVPLIELAIDDWSSITNPREQEIMKRHDRSGSLYFYVRISFFFVWTTIWRIIDLPLYKGDEKLDDRATCVFSDDYTWVYLMSLLYMMIHVFSYVIGNIGEILFWNFGMHLSAQFKILKRRLEDFLLIEDKKESQTKFRQLIKRHYQLLNLSVVLEDSFRAFVAMRIFISQSFICLTAFHLGHYIAAGKFTLAIYTLFFLAADLSTIFVYYYVGDYLTECCEEIGQVFMQCEWHALPKESRRHFGIVIGRCQKPTTLTIVKVYQLNLSNFKFVVRSLHSYVSCIVAIMSYEN